MPTSARQAEAQHLLQVYAQLPIEPRSAEGVYLDCREGRIIDFYGGHAVAALGYAHPDVLACLERQARSLFFQSNAIALPVRAEAADRLAAIAPAGLTRVFFANSGAEANENALRLACRLTGRSRVVAVEHGFHGRTAAAGAATWGSAKWYGFPRAPFDVGFVPRDDVAAARRAVTGETAAVILEPIQGLGGAYDLSREFVAALAQACQAHGALLIVDEVQSGMGRSGHFFASELHGVRPDMLTVAKSLAAGFPCSALLLTEAVASEVRPGELGTTFGGGPMACALVSTVIDVIRRDGLLENVRRLSGYIRARAVVGPVTAVQGRGFLLGLRCGRPAREIQAELLARGILVGNSSEPDVIRLLPPLVLEQGHADQLLDALAGLPAH